MALVIPPRHLDVKKKKDTTTVAMYIDFLAILYHFLEHMSKMASSGTQFQTKKRLIVFILHKTLNSQNAQTSVFYLECIVGANHLGHRHHVLLHNSLLLTTCIGQQRVLPDPIIPCLTKFWNVLSLIT